MRVNVKKIFRKILVVHLWFIGITSFLIVLLNFVNPPFTTMSLYRRVTADYKVKPHRYIKLKEIPKSTRRMLMVMEDYKFYNHFGFDFEAMQRAFKRNNRLGKIKSGGSTITQQVARSIFLTTHRNFFRKYLEAWIALEMEIFLSKDRIMELYFNYVEWGKGIFGIETASQYYYQKSVKKIGLERSKTLITLLANPIRYNPENYYKSRTMRMRYNHISRWM